MAEAAGLYYETHGEAEAPPLILSSGLGGSASYWSPNIPALAEHFHVIAYDHRGTGRSDRDLPDQIDVELMGEDLLRLMDALNIASASLLGHALGGLIGLDVALRYDGRIGKLVVVNGWTGWNGLDPHTERCFDTREELLLRSGATAYLRAQPIFLYPAGWISSHHAGLDAELPHQLATMPATQTILHRIGALRQWRMLHDLPDADVLVIGARDDLLVPVEVSRDLAATLADASYSEMNWGGHACNVTDPDTFNRIVLDFLRS